MSAIATDRQPDAVPDPEAEFISPADIVCHSSLPTRDKLAALERWALTVAARLGAGLENYPGGPYSRDIELSKRIDDAIQLVRAEFHGSAAPLARVVDPLNSIGSLDSANEISPHEAEPTLHAERIASK